ncbi:hypothetical protein, partial [Kocuria salina]|uniref:hypothetical protein n=1 Tax=Kocuria salina TaxID=1929416 RepID=UPI0020D16401
MTWVNSSKNSRRSALSASAWCKVRVVDTDGKDGMARCATEEESSIGKTFQQAPAPAPSNNRTTRQENAAAPA